MPDREKVEMFNEQILSGLRPNFFELVAQEAMHEALRPAFEYLCKVSSSLVTRPTARPSTDMIVANYYTVLCLSEKG